MNMEQIKKLLFAYDDMKRILREGECAFSNTVSIKERSAAAGYFQTFFPRLSPKRLSAALPAVGRTISAIEETFRTEDSDCKACVEQVFFRHQNHTYTEMNCYLSKASVKRYLNHFIGRIYMLLHKNQSLRQMFRKAYAIIQLKNN